MSVASKQLRALVPKRLKRKIRAFLRVRAQHYDGRYALAGRYLNGSGLEVGALHYPQDVPEGTSVRYVDRLNVADLRVQYPELDGEALVEPDVIDDGETLSTVPDNSQDFVIANHFIEHCMNPILTIENHLRVLKTEGVLFMAVPDPRYTFDHDRAVTKLEHLVDDYVRGGEVSRHQHFEEWVVVMDRLIGSAAKARVKELEEIDYSIHFHVWTPWEFVELLTYCKRQLEFPIALEVVEKNHYEFIVILRKERVTASLQAGRSGSATSPWTR